MLPSLFRRLGTIGVDTKNSEYPEKSEVLGSSRAISEEPNSFGGPQQTGTPLWAPD